jgi:hypothetical protein
MYIAYSALQTITQQPEQNNTENLHHELHLRYQAYQSICDKYYHEIDAIQKYLPGWRPSPPTR